MTSATTRPPQHPQRIIAQHARGKITDREAVYRLGSMSPRDAASARATRDRLNLDYLEWSLDKVLDAMLSPPANNGRQRESE